VYRRHNCGRHFSLDLTAGRVVDAIQTIQFIRKSSTSIFPYPPPRPKNSVCGSNQEQRQQSAISVRLRRLRSVSVIRGGKPRQ
jgi:hypothetical protein